MLILLLAFCHLGLLTVWFPKHPAYLGGCAIFDCAVPRVHKGCIAHWLM